jgi:hypothetical protein
MYSFNNSEYNKENNYVVDSRSGDDRFVGTWVDNQLYHGWIYSPSTCIGNNCHCDKCNTRSKIVEIVDSDKQQGVYI